MPVIMPDMMTDEGRVTIHANTITRHYSRMMRWNLDDGRIEFTRVGSERYRHWLAEQPPADGIPPHIAFGGAVVSGPGDPEFFAKWQAHARTLA